MHRRIKSLLVIAAVFICVNAEAATVWVNGAGSNTSPYDTKEKGATSLAAGLAVLIANDTLMIADGTYSSAITTVPSGTSGSYTTIEAETDGGAVLTGGINLAHTVSYTRWEGLQFNYANDKKIEGNHHKFIRCSFNGGGASGYGINTVIGSNDYPDDTSYILMEDCWFYGTGGRYNLLVFLADHIILRRCVARHDGGYGPYSGNPEAGITIYNSQYVAEQNCIVIDSDLSGYVYYGQAFYYVYNSSSAESTSNVAVRGCFVLNTKASCYRTDCGYSAITLGTFTDNIGWKYDQYAVTNGSSNSALTMTVTEGTFGSGVYGFGDWGSGTPSTTYSIYTSISSTAFDGWTNGTGNTATPGAALLYLPRTESGTSGANAITKIGTSGTLYGDTGYATDTGQALWPFPNEDRIKTELAAVSARGFCTGNSIGGTAQTLTKYIWEYLGNQIPDEIYGGEPPTIGTATLSNGTVGTAYSQTLQATGGTQPYAWEVTAGTLPAGLSLNASTGAITGTPTTATTYNFTVMVVDDVAAYDSQDLTIIVNAAAVVSGSTCSGGSIFGGSF
jgi:hypothetical protein